MPDGRSKWMFRLGTTLMVIAIGWAVWVRFLPRETRNDEATFGQFLLALIVFLTAGLTALRARSGSDTQARATADDLADAVHAQWKDAAGQRKLIVPAPIPLRWRPAALSSFGSVDTVLSDAPAAVPFPPLPGMPAATRQTVAGGGRQELLQLYGGLPTGRLVITGPAGSGKTSTGVLLVLDALEHRTGLAEPARARTPVPILLSLSSWDPLTASLESWLVTRLREAYPAIRSRPAQMIHKLCRDGSLSLILDGLDEVPPPTRVNILEALGNQANGRVVVLSRPEELALAARTRYLTGALVVALEPVDGDAVATYLERSLNRPAPASWDAFLTELRSQPAAGGALTRPLTVTLLRDTVEPSDDVSDLLGSPPPGGPDLESRLIDRFTESAYRNRLDPAAGNGKVAARHALGWIAADMDRRGTADLGWWQLPLMVPPVRRAAHLAAVTFPVFGIGWSWSTSVTAGGPGHSQFSWDFSTLPAALAAVSFGALATLTTQRRLTGAWKPERTLVLTGVVGVLCGLLYGIFGDNLMRALVAALGIAFGSGLPALVSRTRLSGRVHRRPFGVLLLIAAGAAGIVAVDLKALLAVPVGLLLLFAVVVVLRITRTSDTSSLGPIDTWRGDAAHAVVSGAIFGGVAGLAVMANWNPFAESRSGPAPLVGGSMAFVYYLLAGVILAFLAHSSGQTWIAALWLHREARTPLRVLAFLEDARRRDLLRTVGALYQFRHATLQDRLAAAARTPDPVRADAPGPPEHAP